LDEAFGLAVGARSVGAGEDVGKVTAAQVAAEKPTAVAASVVGHDAEGLDAELGIVGQGGIEEGDGGALRLIGQELDEGDAGVIVDGDVEILPSGVSAAATSRTVRRTTGTSETPQGFNIEMEQAAGSGIFIAYDGWRRGLEGPPAM